MRLDPPAGCAAAVSLRLKHGRHTWRLGSRGILPGRRCWGTGVSDRTEVAGDIDVALDDVERARWFMHHILPHEAALRSWLSRRRAPAAFDIDDIVQESYALLAERERLD